MASLLSSLVIAACLLATVVAGASAATAPPAGFRDVGPAPRAASLPLLVAVTQPGASKIAGECNAVSDPDSARYGQHLSIDRVADVLGASDNAARVAAWLRDMGAARVHVVRTGDWVRATVPIPALEEQLGVQVRHFRGMSKAGEPLVVYRATTMYTLPEAVASAVDLVVGVSEFPQLDVNPTPARRDVGRLRALQESSDGLATIAIPLITDTHMYIGLISSCGKCADDAPAPVDGACSSESCDLESVNVRIQPHGGAEYNVTVPIAEASVQFEGICFVNTTVGVNAFTFYNMSVQYVCQGGATSTWGGLPMQWDTLPADWKGVAATPTMTPSYTYSFYGLSDQTGGASSVTQGVAEFAGQFFNMSDLEVYAKLFNVDLAETTIVGPNTPSLPGLEAQMDIELMMTVAPNVHTYFWSTAMNQTLTGAWILEWATAMSDATDIPDVTSISYGLPECAEANPEVPCGNDYYERTNTELVKLCTRGVSVMVCSQDAGATADGHGGTNCDLHPEYPATSPWVTTVGSTVPSALAPARPNVPGIGEAAVSLNDGTIWTTGGGFSMMAANAQPHYQAEAVSKYLATAKNLPTGHFNASGRAYPDVAMVGSNYPVTIGGNTIPIGDGTSSSTPIFSSVITLLNQARAAAGKSPLGFLNPLLYKLASTNPEVFYDVVVGDNRCGEYLCCPMGYETAVGFDAATGLGSIGDFEALRKLVLALP